ncbi:hypothetical protein [Vibrio penaeicida]|uniref:hypothetical protein n=1 Tax=Vibrio penaeicida TaxID=104609 RepID=UPI000CEA0C7A|nr:hypothetical protein [Vibrio penaeicida]
MTVQNMDRDSAPNVKRGRIILLALVGLFAMPAIVAKVILEMNWYQPGVTNQGVLVEPDSYLTDYSMGSESEKQWQLGYVLPKECNALCRQQLHLLQQSYVSLGKYQERVRPTVYIHPNSDTSVLQDYSFNRVKSNDKFLSDFSTNEYIIVDPRGQLVMHYPKQINPELLVQQSKGLIADFKKLLKLSRVG